MSKGELPSNIPEGVAQHADNSTESLPVSSATKVDPYRANRELERWLFGGLNMDSLPRPDQRGTSDTYDRLPSTPPLSADWKDDAELIGTVVYSIDRNDAGEIVDITQTFEYADKDQKNSLPPESDK